MKRRPQGGFMLVEALVWLMLTALLLQAVFPMLAVSFLSWETSAAQMETHQTARMAMETMTRELRYASAISRPLPEQYAADKGISVADVHEAIAVYAGMRPLFDALDAANPEVM